MIDPSHRHAVPAPGSVLVALLCASALASACTSPVGQQLCVEDADCPSPYLCNLQTGFCEAPPAVDAATGDALGADVPIADSAEISDRGHADLATAPDGTAVQDATVPGDAAGPADTADPPVDAAVVSPDAAGPDAAGPPTDATVPDTAVSPDDATTPAEDATTPAEDAALTAVDGGVMPTDATLTANDAWISPSDAAVGVDQDPGDPCALVSCQLHASCTEDHNRNPVCVCDVAVCGDDSCQPPGGCCEREDCGAGAWLCTSSGSCHCAASACGDGFCPGADQCCAQTVTKADRQVSPGANNTWGSSYGEVWDLTKCDMLLSFRYDASGLDDSIGGGATAWIQFGVHTVSVTDFNPSNQGVWMSATLDPTVGTLAPNSSQDIDDKLMLQHVAGEGEGGYDLPWTPTQPHKNHRFWFDRDATDYITALSVDGGTYNTGGLYEVELRLHAENATDGTAYMTVNGLYQGFETNDEWWNMEMSPAGLNFTANLTQLETYIGMTYSAGSNSVWFRNIEITGCQAGCQ